MSVSYRVLSDSDSEEVHRLIESAWDLMDYGTSQEVLSGMHSAYLSGIRSVGDHAEVAVAGGRVVGVLVGRTSPDIRVDQSMARRTSEMLGVAGSEEGGRRFIGHLSLIADADGRMMSRHPGEADCELCLLIVAPEFRGMRVGKGLLDRFTVRLRAEGRHRMAVFTDSYCDTGFYDAIGCRLLDAERFPLPPSEKPDSFYMYVMDLDDRSATGVERP